MPIIGPTGSTGNGHDTRNSTTAPTIAMTATAITSLSRVRGRDPSQARGGVGRAERISIEGDGGKVRSAGIPARISSGKDGTTSPPGGPASLHRRTATTTPTTITRYTTTTTEGVDWNP